MQTTPSTFPIVIYLKIEGISIIFIYSRSLEETRSKRLVEDQDSSRSKKRRRCWFELIYSRWRYWKALLKDYLWEILLFFNIGDISFGEMIRRKVIRREKGNLTSFHPLFFIFISSLFSVSIHPVSRLSKELMEGWRCPPRWGSKINALPSKFYEVEKRDAASFVTRVPPPFLSFFFFSKKIGDEKDTIRCRFSFFFFFFDSNITYRFRFAIERRFFTLWRVLDHRTNEIGFNMHWYFVIQVEWQPFFFFWRRDDQWSNLEYLGYTI